MDERINVRWAGEVHPARVLRRYKNGRIRVEVQTNVGTLGGRPGTVRTETMTIEPWQEIHEEHSGE